MSSAITSIIQTENENVKLESKLATKYTKKTTPNQANKSSEMSPNIRKSVPVALDIFCS